MLHPSTALAQFPYLIDPNTGTEMYESDAIISYLFNTYGDGKAREREAQPWGVSRAPCSLRARRPALPQHQ